MDFVLVLAGALLLNVVGTHPNMKKFMSVKQRMNLYKPQALQFGAQLILGANVKNK
jgi:hypothetical protein